MLKVIVIFVLQFAVAAASLYGYEDRYFVEYVQARFAHVFEFLERII